MWGGGICFSSRQPPTPPTMHLFLLDAHEQIWKDDVTVLFLLGYFPCRFTLKQGAKPMPSPLAKESLQMYNVQCRREKGESSNKSNKNLIVYFLICCAFEYYCCILVSFQSKLFLYNLYDSICSSICHMVLHYFFCT